MYLCHEMREKCKNYDVTCECVKQRISIARSRSVVLVDIIRKTIGSVVQLVGVILCKISTGFLKKLLSKETHRALHVMDADVLAEHTYCISIRRAQLH